ncbi:hypothetical protein ABZ799_01340 [Nocardiopsis dassonvillei]|uniref:hypothetical protein n=1 Tax=Nocardiopsis dassonvillei TaxID=2014 RepID=UPI0033F163EE
MAEKKNEAKVVTVAEGPEHGFYGDPREHDSNDQYTVAGVTGGTAKVTDTPKSVTREGTKARS